MSDIHFMSVLGIGFLLGAHHALDADHVAAVTTILSKRPSLRTSGWIGLCWGSGHTVMLLMVGMAIIGLKVTVTERLADLFEFCVGLMLVGLGGSLALKAFRDGWHMHAHTHDGQTHLHLHSHAQDENHSHEHWLRKAAQPFIVGLVHGLAGSAALALMVLSTVRSLWEGMAYILVFGAGSILGMVALGCVITVPLMYSASLGPRALGWVQGLAGLGSLGLGITMIVQFSRT